LGWCQHGVYVDHVVCSIGKKKWVNVNMVLIWIMCHIELVGNFGLVPTCVD